MCVSFRFACGAFEAATSGGGRWKSGAALPVADEAAPLFPQRSENARISVSPQRFPGTARRTKSFPRNHTKKHPSIGRVFLHAIAGNDLRLCSPGYETDERSSLGYGACPLPVAEEGQAPYPQRSKTARISVSPQQFSGTARRGAAITRRSLVQILPPQPKRKRRFVRLFSFCL